MRADAARHRLGLEPPAFGREPGRRRRARRAPERRTNRQQEKTLHDHELKIEVATVYNRLFLFDRKIQYFAL